MCVFMRVTRMHSYLLQPPNPALPPKHPAPIHLQIGGGRKATQARRQAAAEAVLATGGFDTSITNYQSLLAIAKQQGAVGSGAATRGACKVCGQMGHLTKQCRNGLASGGGEEAVEGSGVGELAVPIAASEDDAGDSLDLSSDSSDDERARWVHAAAWCCRYGGGPGLAQAWVLAQPRVFVARWSVCLAGRCLTGRRHGLPARADAPLCRAAAPCLPGAAAGRRPARRRRRRSASTRAAARTRSTSPPKSRRRSARRSAAARIRSTKGRRSGGTAAAAAAVAAATRTERVLGGGSRQHAADMPTP